MTDEAVQWGGGRIQCWFIRIVTGLNVTLGCQSHVDGMCAITNQVLHSKMAKSIKTKPFGLLVVLVTRWSTAAPGGQTWHHM